MNLPFISSSSKDGWFLALAIPEVQISDILTPYRVAVERLFAAKQVKSMALLKQLDQAFAEAGWKHIKRSSINLGIPAVTITDKSELFRKRIAATCRSSRYLEPNIVGKYRPARDVICR